MKIKKNNIRLVARMIAAAMAAITNAATVIPHIKRPSRRIERFLKNTMKKCTKEIQSILNNIFATQTKGK